jgi:two-component system cell cycle sensor histidine kinase/response regulator CckA
VPEMPAIAAEEDEAETEGNETILVVEDEDALRELIREQLEDFGYRVLVAQDGGAALDVVALEAEPIDLLLADVVMPGLNGWELSQSLLRERPSLKVLLMSGYAVDVMAEHGGIDPDTPLISKPFTGHALAAKVREVLARGGSVAPGTS